MILKLKDGTSCEVTKNTGFSFLFDPKEKHLGWQFQVKNGFDPSVTVDFFKEYEKAEAFYKKVAKALKRGEKSFEVGLE